LAIYLYGLDNPELKKRMTEGICNELNNNFDPELGKASIGDLKIMLANYKHLKESMPVKTRVNKTLKKPKTETKTKSKTKSKAKTKSPSPEVKEEKQRIQPFEPQQPEQLIM
jgi:hypothetical protein